LSVRCSYIKKKRILKTAADCPFVVVMSRDQIIDPPNRNEMNGTADCPFAAVMSGDQQIKLNRPDRKGMNGTTDCPFVAVIKTAADCPFAGVMTRDQIIDPPNINGMNGTGADCPFVALCQTNKRNERKLTGVCVFVAVVGIQRGLAE